MQFPVTRGQLQDTVQKLGFSRDEARAAIEMLEAEGRIHLEGAIARVPDPTTPGAQMLAALCREAQGGTAGSVGIYKIREFIQEVLGLARVRGRSRRA